jgi:hypothetical protein
MVGTPWTADEVAALRRMRREQGHSFLAIGQKLGRSCCAVTAKCSKLHIAVSRQGKLRQIERGEIGKTKCAPGASRHTAGHQRQRLQNEELAKVRVALAKQALRREIQAAIAERSTAKPLPSLMLG